MRWNATFRFKKATTSQFDENGYPVTQPSEWQNGTLCQVDRNAPPSNQQSDGGQLFVYSYTMYTSVDYSTQIEAGDTIEVNFRNGVQMERQVLGVDNTDRKRFAVWL